MFSFPSHQEIDRIYDEVMADRKKNVSGERGIVKNEKKTI